MQFNTHMSKKSKLTCQRQRRELEETTQQNLCKMQAYRHFTLRMDMPSAASHHDKQNPSLGMSNLRALQNSQCKIAMRVFLVWNYSNMQMFFSLFEESCGGWCWCQVSDFLILLVEFAEFELSRLVYEEYLSSYKCIFFYFDRTYSNSDE